MSNQGDKTLSSYRYPISRPPNFPFISDVHCRLAHRPIITGGNGLYSPYENYVKFSKRKEVGEITHRIPLERNLKLLHPCTRKNWSFKPDKPEFRYTLPNFHRYRLQKLIQQPGEISDVYSQNYCETCCAKHQGGTYGCNRNSLYATHGTLPQTYFSVGCREEQELCKDHYGYLHQRLDSHSTGNFWLSKYA
ncbi:unnamed protein product [Heterobilharzia americana]|nr:unnamed protein product [Heterobilharzia americana]